MKKPNKSFILGIAVAFLVLVFAGLFLIDLGINSKFFINKHFTKAFEYRSTGDCNSFANYLYQDVDEWRSTCEKEKVHDAEPIRYFIVQNVSHKFGSDRAFLQVELTRNAKGKDYTYSISYEMKKDGLRWKIDQEKK
ncbi:MAG: hypothetical protein Q8Q48_00555 [Candidatus Staskawiczbacteria bacterium]|nr:hypothetical protein [Candidatus Staskawiczbacteria bacterium]